MGRLCGSREAACAALCSEQHGRGGSGVAPGTIVCERAECEGRCVRWRKNLEAQRVALPQASQASHGTLPRQPQGASQALEYEQTWPPWAKKAAKLVDESSRLRSPPLICCR
ncbi:hypothetical protein L1887_49069 [Cichorium endivia]|nr:hypothetical protein L1887_49069 [Cichorium endivia]